MEMGLIEGSKGDLGMNRGMIRLVVKYKLTLLLHCTVAAEKLVFNVLDVSVRGRGKMKQRNKADEKSWQRKGQKIEGWLSQR